MSKAGELIGWLAEMENDRGQGDWFSKSAVEHPDFADRWPSLSDDEVTVSIPSSRMRKHKGRSVSEAREGPRWSEDGPQSRPPWGIHPVDREELADRFGRAASEGPESPQGIARDYVDYDELEDSESVDSYDELDDCFEKCAWYRPIHVFGRDWGIYIRRDCILQYATAAARELRDPGAAALLVVQRQLFFPSNDN